MPQATQPRPVYPLPAGASAVYDTWLTHNNDNATHGREAIDPVASASYAYIWQAWCKFLCTRHAAPGPHDAAPWQLATPEDVVAFLHSGMRRLKHGHPTNTAQRRYWSVLSRVYAFAHAQDWVQRNPALELTLRDTPFPEITYGTVLPPAVRQAFLQCLPSLYGSPLEVRDRAMFLLLLTLGLTPQEVRELCIQDLEREADTGRVVFVKIHANRSPTQQRRLAVDQRTSEALLHWLGQRPLLTVLKRPRPGHTASTRAAAAREPLFLSQKSPRISMGTLLHVTRGQILKASALACVGAPPRLGPQVLRNTALVHWLNEGIEVGKVARMAGLKNAKGLRHLINHVNAEVRTHLALADKRDDEPPPPGPMSVAP